MAVYLKVMELWGRVSQKLHAFVFPSKLQLEITQSLRAATNLTGDKLIYEFFLMWVSTLSDTGPDFIGVIGVTQWRWVTDRNVAAHHHSFSYGMRSTQQYSAMGQNKSECLLHSLWHFQQQPSTQA